MIVTSFPYLFPDFLAVAIPSISGIFQSRITAKIVAAGLVPRRAAFHGFLAGQDPFTRYADLLKGCNSAFAAGLVIVHDQYRQIEQFFFLFLLVLLKLQIDRDSSFPCWERFRPECHHSSG